MLDLLARQAENRGVNHYVLTPRQIGMKTGTQFQQSGHAAFDPNRALAWAAELRGDIQQRTLSCPVVAENRQAFPIRHRERYVMQGDETIARFAANQVAQAVADQHLPAVLIEPFRDAVKAY